jgi:hypothetical protein
LFSPFNGQGISDAIVHVNVPEVRVQAGKRTEISVFVSVRKGYHIQANQVTDELIIPTTMEMEAQDIVVAEKQIFPSAKRFKLSGSTDPLLVYDGDFVITIPITASEVKNGKYVIPAKLHYQACDEKMCYAPQTVVFSVDVLITSKVATIPNWQI